MNTILQMLILATLVGAAWFNWRGARAQIRINQSQIEINTAQTQHIAALQARLAYIEQVTGIRLEARNESMH